MPKIWIRSLLFYRKLSRFLYKRVVLILTTLLFLGLGIALIGIYGLSLNLVDSQAIHYASVAVKIMDKARVLYSKNVVAQVKFIDEVTVTPEYHEVNGSIPNPATYTIELGEQLSDEAEGMLFRLYSDYPFPNRQKTGGPKDQFGRDALNYLKQNPDKSFYRKEKVQERLTFRYTEAIRMEPSCINCHNTLPSSPKKDWQVGDVRGIIEITQPLDGIMLIANDGLKVIYTVLTIILTLAITGLILVLARFRAINKELEEKVADRTQALKLLATTDELTQLANRRQFDTVFKEEWRRAWRMKTNLSLILCDIDHFKKYNDTYGHQAGDICLHSVAQILQKNVKRAGEMVARYGGEEFIIVLPNVNQEDAIKIATLIRYSLHQLAIPHESSSVRNYVTLSMGIATVIPQNNFCADAEKIIKIADDNLYRAKQEGRDRWFVKAIDYLEN